MGFCSVVLFPIFNFFVLFFLPYVLEFISFSLQTLSPHLTASVCFDFYVGPLVHCVHLDIIRGESQLQPEL